MDPSKANPREHLRQAIDTEIKSLEESIRALKLRRNALTPISSLPTEVITAIFSLLRLPVASPLGGKPDHNLAWLRVTHVCRQWREIALDLPLLWSHVDFTTVSPAGATEILARAKKAPLSLEARLPIFRWDDSRFSALQQELRTHVSHICHLSISAESVYLQRTIEALISPAPILEYLSLSIEKYRHRTPLRVSIPDTLFNGTTPRLSCLKLCDCNISWKSPLLKGLKNLEILTLSVSKRPKLAVWLDALDEMPQLKRLVLRSATPVVLFPFNIEVERTVTLPFLTHFDISGCVEDCALALAHLVLPALTRLCLTAKSNLPNGGDVLKILPYVTRHAHGPQDTRPLRSMLIRAERTRADILAWPAPGVDIDVCDTSHAATLSARVALSITSKDWFIPDAHIGVLNAAIAALPLDSLRTLTAHHRTLLNEQFWLRHAPRWPLLQRVRLASPAAGGLREMLLQDNGGGGCPLLPSLTRLDLVETALSARRTLRLCDAFMKRAEQGVPLEALDLSTCFVTSRAVRLLSEIVVDVWGPAEDLEKESILFAWDSATRDPFVSDDNSGTEDYSDEDNEDDTSSSDDDEERDEEEEDDEAVEGYPWMEED
ncbi:hypothetical protein BJY52DRAFT_834031 [Lactarius psammicola]|nr:hypothetical protein BJY52DRAFT_834031 [Lactarius psammicola]